MIESLATYRHCVERIRTRWPAFLERRRERLAQQDRHGAAAERVAENILEDLFTMVLDWSLSDINNQVGYADLLLTRLGVKHLLVEVKRPGALAWNAHAVEAALRQARGYASEQKVKCVSVSDGVMFYAADIEHGGLQDRVFASLESPEPQDTLWWASVHGIYRPRTDASGAALHLLPKPSQRGTSATVGQGQALLHSKYKLPMDCFAYVGDAHDPRSWRLPYALADGSIDVNRLPKAIQCILSNYRGAQVSGIPEKDIPTVLVRLGRAAAQLGRMPHQAGQAAPIYQRLAEALEQLGRLHEVTDG